MLAIGVVALLFFAGRPIAYALSSWLWIWFTRDEGEAATKR